MKAGLSDPEPLADIFTGVRVESKREPELQTLMRAHGMRMFMSSSHNLNHL